jgi:ribosomal protein L3 glutamine methyltransferase
MEYRREPELGLLGGEDGLDLVVRILCEAGRHLTDEGILILEVGSSAAELERRLPGVPWTWLEFERGGEGVLLLTRAQIDLHQRQFEEA